MLEIGWTELLVVAVVLIVVVGPKDLPPMLRAFGKMTTRLRTMAGEFRSQFDEALREADLDDVRRTIDDAKKLNPANSLRDAINPLRQAGEDIRADLKKAASIDRKTDAASSTQAPLSVPEPAVSLADTPPVIPAPEAPAATSAPVVPDAASAPKRARKSTAKTASTKTADGMAVSSAKPKSAKAEKAAAPVSAKARSVKPASTRTAKTSSAKAEDKAAATKSAATASKKDQA